MNYKRKLTILFVSLIIWLPENVYGEVIDDLIAQKNKPTTNDEERALLEESIIHIKKLTEQNKLLQKQIDNLYIIAKETKASHYKSIKTYIKKLEANKLTIINLKDDLAATKEKYIELTKTKFRKPFLSLCIEGGITYSLFNLEDQQFLDNSEVGGTALVGFLLRIHDEINLKIYSGISHRDFLVGTSLYYILPLF